MKTIKQLFVLVAMLCMATSAWAEKEAYAVLQSNGEGWVDIGSDPMMGPMSEQAQTLTFYYDEEKASRSGTKYSMNTGTNTPGWTSATNIAGSITQVVFDPSFADYQPTTCYKWFSHCSNLHTITGIEYLNTSSVTSMYYMFVDCENLATLDLKHFNTSNVTNMSYMFFSCSFTTLDLSYFNTSNVTNMSEMFSNCNTLKTIYVGDEWDVSNVSYSDNMFNYCSELVGGNGTTYSSSNKNKYYARVDAPGTPGYLTYKYHPTAYFYYEGDLLFTLQAPKNGGTVTLPSKADLLSSYYLKNVSYTYSGGAFTSETVINDDVDVTVTGTLMVTRIGNNATSKTSSAPYQNGYNYSTVQMIYEAGEMGGAATIRGIAFKVAQASELATTSVDIYLGHKASTTFSSTTDYVAPANLTHVYSGSPTLGTQIGWEMLNFNVANFDYNGTDNLVVVVCKKATSSTSSLKYYYESKSNHAICRYSGNYQYDGEISNTSYSYQVSYRPSVTFLTFDINAQDVELSDDGGYSITENTEVSSATYKKTLDSDRVGKYQAWFVPFNYQITADDLTKFDFFKINFIANAAQEGVNPEDDHVYIFLNPMEAGDVLYGNKPYVYRPKEAVTNYEFKTELATLLAKTNASVLQNSTAKATYDFYGTYENTTATNESPFYYVNINGQISYGTTVTVGPYRWILRATAKGVSYAPKFTFMEDETTGIANANVNVNLDENVYDLQGRRVANSQKAKGLYIVNGRKVVIK